MRRTALIAAAIGGLVASSSFGAFTFSAGTPNKTLIPGKQVVQLYALNNGGTTGSLAKALTLSFTPTAGSKIYVSADNGGTVGDPTDDTIDLPNAAGVSPTLATAGNGFSYVRLGTAAQTFQVEANPPSADLYPNGGISSFTVTETTTANVNSSATVNGGLGLRFAVVVLDAAATTLTMAGQFAGDAGSAQPVTQTFQLSNVPEPTTLSALALTGLGMIRRRK